MRFLTNTYDPRKNDAPLNVSRVENETHAEAWERYQKWLADKVLGEPVATTRYIVEELKKMGTVGVYE